MMFDRRIAMVLIGSSLGIGLAMPVKAQQVVLTPSGSAFQAPPTTNPFEGALPAPKLTPEEQKYVDWMNDPMNLPFPGPVYTPPEGKPLVYDPQNPWGSEFVADVTDGKTYTREEFNAKYGIQLEPISELDPRVTMVGGSKESGTSLSINQTASIQTISAPAPTVTTTTVTNTTTLTNMPARLLPTQNVRFAETSDSPLSSSRIMPMGMR
jgi:hypothetical protein